MKRCFWYHKKILITGGAGFIGSNLAKNLVNNGSIVTIVDNLERGKLEYIKDIENEIKFIKLDLSDEYSCGKLFEDKYDIVIHLASKVGGIGFYLSNPYSVMNTMIKVDSNILNNVIRSKIKYYFYASSAHVYPKELQQSADSLPIFEDQDFPSNPELSYGWAKLVGEKQIQYAAEENPFLKFAIGRYVGIYGPNQDYDLKTGSVIPVFINRVINYPTVPFTIWGTGQETRSYCYIEDAIECTKLMVEKLDKLSKVGPLNIGKKEKVKIQNIAQKIIKISGKNIPISYDKTKETKIWGQWCDCSKAYDVLGGWQANVSFEDGLLKVYHDIQRRIKDAK